MSVPEESLEPVIVQSIYAADLDAVDRALAAVPQGVAWVEIRADELDAGRIPEAVRRSRRPTIVTVRRPEDHGRFEGPESEREARLGAALDAGAAYVDVESGSELADRMIARWPERCILSRHGVPCTASALEEAYGLLIRSAAPLLKLVPDAARVDQLDEIRKILERAARDGRRLACFAAGRAGTASRMLAPSWGSWATYGATAPGEETAPGQLTGAELAGLFDVTSIGARTRRFALFGEPIALSPSPAMHHAVYRDAGLDACYLPLETGDVDVLARTVEAFRLQAFGVTIPLKQAVARRCRPGDRWAAASGSVNTVTVGDDGWTGFNTDGPAAVALLSGAIELEGATVALVGAGGTARAVAAALSLAGARVIVFNRTEERALRLAEELGVEARPLADLGATDWEGLVHATPLGRGGETAIDPSALGGRVVLDVVYGPRPTPLIEAARARGLAALDGLALLVEQARLQLARMTGGALPKSDTMEGAARAWLSSRAG